ncbi:MAG: 50S ribosomal protein L25/general stress protein Ctc [Bacteroidota bacterium]
MKFIAISGSKRENVGKKDAKLLRRQGKVPCILYGGEQQLFFSAEENSFKKLVYTPEMCAARLDIEGKQYNAVLKEIQFHPVTDRILHVDFLEVFDDKKVTVNVPVKLVGVSKGVLEGGQLIVKNRRLKVKALFAKIPDHIEVNIENIKIGNSAKVADLEFEDVAFLDPPNSVILVVKAPRELIEVTPIVKEVGKEALEEGAEGEKKEGEEGKPEDTPPGASKEPGKEGKDKGGSWGDKKQS